MVRKVFVVGATGRVGSQAALDLAERGVEVYAGGRVLDRLPKHENITPIALDLAQASVNELAEKFQGMDAILFTAGSRGKDLLRIDAFGAVKAMQAAEKSGVNRFVLLSSMYVLQPEKWQEEPLKSADLEEFNIAKFFADHYLMDSTNLNYTILQPTGLTETPYTGKITTEYTNTTQYKNSIPDVAMTLAEIILHPEWTSHRVIMMTGGDTPIIEAIAQ